MKYFKSLQDLLFLVNSLASVVGMYTQIQSKESIGCYTESEESRIFRTSAGDYDPSDISPIKCVTQCGIKYKYAALQHGNLCLCANSIPTSVKLSDAECNSTCPGSNGWPESDKIFRCGGQMKNSIYTAQERILGLSLHSVDTLPILEPVTIYGTLINGANVSYTYDLGDGTRMTLPSNQVQVRHIYDQPGSYVVTFTASNAISGSVSTSYVYKVDDPISGVKLSCPKSATVGQVVECNGTVARGSRVNSTFEFSNGYSESLSVSAQYYTTGAVVPRTNDTLQGTPLSIVGSVVTPAYEFQHSGRVTHWDFEAIKVGFIKFQIYHPVCTDGKIYCVFSKSCSSSSSTCIPLHHRRCAVNEIFCIFHKRCLHNTQDSMRSCSYNSPYNFNTPPVDYKLIFQYSVEVKKLGHHIFALPLADQPEVEEGDVLGWEPEFGQLAYKDIPPDQGVAFLYPKSLSVGNTLLRSMTPTLLRKYFIFAAHIAHEARFVVRGKFDTNGIQSVSSNITGVTQVAVDYPIYNVSFSYRSMVNTNDTISFIVHQHQGSNVTYKLDFGNGAKLRTYSPTINHVFLSEGIFLIKLTAENSVGNVVVSGMIHVYDRITSLKFSKCPVEAKAFGQPTVIKWGAARGTNVTYVVDFGDASSRYKVVTTESNSRNEQTTHQYDSIGNYTVTVYAYNPPGPNVSVSCYAMVEISLVGLEFSVPLERVTSNIYLATGDYMIITRHLQEGSHFKCSFDFQDGKPALVTDQGNVTHQYTSPGKYQIETTCYNDISSISKSLNALVVVEELEALSGLSVRGTATRLGSVSSVTMQMNKGTTYFCLWDFGDGLLNKTDASQTGKPMTHFYNAINTYNIEVSCTNRLGTVRARTDMPVDSVVENAAITSNKQYVRVFEEILFNVTVLKGSRLHFRIDYGDGTNASLQRNGRGQNLAGEETFTHAYTTDGSFTVAVTVSNSFNSIVQTLDYSIVVEFPIQDIMLQSNSPVSLDPGIVIFYLDVLENLTVPTGGQCVWMFNDGTPVSSPESLKLKPLGRTHKFTKEGSYVTHVNISNHVSSVVLETVVKVQKIKHVTIEPQRFVDGVLERGSGPQNMYFKVSETVVFKALSQDGDISYSWDFGDGNSLNKSTISFSNHTFMTPSLYSVRVIVHNNIFGLMTSNKIIFIQQPVGNALVKTTFPAYFNDPTFYYINIGSRGSDSCLLLAFGDNQGARLGSESCRPRLILPNETFIKIPNDQRSINYSHTYVERGNYSVVLSAWNYISISTFTTKVSIKDFSCLLPEVKIDSPGTRSNPRKIKKSEPIVLGIDLEYKCPVARSIVFTWVAYEVTLANPDDNSKPVKLPSEHEKKFDLPAEVNLLDAGALRIKERYFPFMMLKFSLKVGFVGRDRDLSHMSSIQSVWIDIESSELSVIIEGGQRRSVGYELHFILDGSKSKDPDNPFNKTGIIYSWLCRKKDEEFPTSLNPPNPKGGCWGNGNYTVNSTNNKAKVYTGDLFQNAVYVFKLTCTKNGRSASFEQSVTVLPGQPPTISLSCNFNCLKKINPLERLVIETRCVDCRPSDQLGYQWSFFRLDLGKDKNKMESWVKQTNWAANTSTGIDKGNLVLKPQVLIPGREYFLRLNAWKPGGYPGGFVEHQFEVNMNPTGGMCVVNPLEGFALETDFKVQCDNWHDTDTPLQYMIELANGEDIVPLFTGIEPTTSAVFPLGKVENNYTIEVRIKVMDKYFMTTSTTFSVRVIAPNKVDYNEVGNSVSSAVGSGNPQEATQITNAVSSVLNSKAEKTDANDTNAKDERANFRGKIAKSLTDMPADSFDGVAQKGEALNALTEVTDEVKEDAQEASIKAMDDMGSYLTGADSSRNLDTTAKSLFAGIGNMVGASSKTAKKAQNATGGDPGKSTNNTKKALGVVDKVSGALMKQLVAGDGPKAIKTKNMDLAIGRKNLYDLGADNDDDEDEGDTGGFRLPDPAALFGGANATTEEGATSGIGSTMTAMGENPFPNEKASDLNSKTIGLALTDGNGKPLDLAGQTLEMFVPRDLKNNPLKPLELNHYATDDPPMRVHKFNRTSNESAIAIEIQVFHPKIKFAIMIRFTKRPSATHFDFNHTFPSLEEAAKMRRRPHPFTYVINHVKLKEKLLYGLNDSEVNNGAGPNGTGPNGTAGAYYLGIKAINLDELGSVNNSYAMRIYLPACKSFDEETNDWVTNGCVVGNKTRANVTHCVCMPGVEDDNDIDPTALPATSAQNNNDQTVPVRKRFVRKKVSKLSLASSFFPAPNPIDFNKVFNVNILENPISLVTVLTIFLVYVILAVYARKEDKKDIERAGVTPLEDNDPMDHFHYEITVYTGYGKKAGTTSQVSFTLAGDEGESQPRVLKDSKRKIFQRRGVDIFLATFPESLGELNYLHIWHDNSGRSASWYLSRVVIEDLNNDKKYLFINESWMAVEKGDGTVDRLIAVAGKDDITSFNHLFYSTTQTKLADGHLWFSIFMRPAKSRFTRLQRLSCCLTLLYCSMLANAMFYNIGGESDPSSTVHIGPLSFSPAQIGIGIMSSLVVVPVNIFIVTVFRGVEAKPTAFEIKERRSRKFWWFYELFFCFFDRSKPKNDFINILHKNHNPDDQFLNLSSASRTSLSAPQGQTMDDNLSNSSRVNLTETEDQAMTDFGLGDDDIDFKISKQEKRDEMARRMKKKKKKKKMFPYWFLYVGWAVCGMTCFVCAFFIVLYGLQFGKEKSAQWLSSMLVSFFQDVLISQPIKVVMIALVFAAIIKKPPEEEDDDDKKRLEDEEFLHEPTGFVKRDKRMKPKTMICLKPPDEEKLKRDREQRFKEMRMNAVIREVLLYVFFVTCLCIVSYSYRDPTSYLFRNSMYDTFVEGKYGGIRGFSSISSRESFYEWAKTTLIDGLFKTSGYTGKLVEPGFTADGMAYVVGGARLRQLRVEKGSCKVPYQMRRLIKPCSAWYGYFTEDNNQYDVAWRPLKNESLYRPPFTFESWEFNDSSQLDSMPVMAKVSTYGGGGFAAELGETKEHASKVIAALENNTWIDAQTRAVITEVATYNAVSNLFCVMTLIVEFLPTQGIFLFTDLKISRLFSTSGGMNTFIVACEFFILIFFMVFIYQECKQLYQMKKKYFKEFWNCVEFTMVILVLTCVCMFLMRIKMIEKAISKIESNPGKFVSFLRVASWSEAFMVVVSFLVFVTWLKGMKLLRFNQRIQVLSQTIKGSAGPLATFSVVFLVFFMAYALFAFAVFGKDLESYYNFVTTSESVMGLLLGAFDYGEIESAQPIIGPIFFFTFMVFGNFIIMNMFLTIIMDVFAEVKDEVGDSDSEFEVVEYMIKRFRRATGVTPNKIAVDDPVEKKGIEDKFKEDMKGLKKKRKNRHGQNAKPMMESEITKRFTRLDDSLKGFYCQDFVEERMLEDMVEKKWGVSTQHSYADATMDLEIEEEREIIRHDMYVALDNFETSYDDGSFNLAFEDNEFLVKQH